MLSLLFAALAVASERRLSEFNAQDVSESNPVARLGLSSVPTEAEALPAEFCGGAVPIEVWRCAVRPLAA